MQRHNEGWGDSEMRKSALANSDRDVAGLNGNNQTKEKKTQLENCETYLKVIL